MVKRVISVLLIVSAACVLMVVPVFGAIAVADPNYRYTAFAFDRVVVGSGYVAPCPWNQAIVDEAVLQQGETQQEDLYFLATTTYENSQIVARCVVKNSSYVPLRVTFEADYLYFDTASDQMTVMFPTQYGGAITVSCNVLEYVLANGRYVVQEIPRTMQVNTFGQYFDVGYVLAQLAQDTGVLGFSDVRVSYESQTNVTGDWSFAVLTNPSLERDAYLDMFVAKQDMRYTDSDTMDVGTFLVTSVGAFLDFQLIPGLSISGILGIIVTIALVFWFITLLV